jgi:ABC-type transporter Mla subunit MlaD
VEGLMTLDDLLTAIRALNTTDEDLRKVRDAMSAELGEKKHDIEEQENLLVKVKKSQLWLVRQMLDEYKEQLAVIYAEADN